MYAVIPIQCTIMTGCKIADESCFCTTCLYSQSVREAITNLILIFNIPLKILFMNNFCPVVVLCNLSINTFDFPPSLVSIYTPLPPSLPLSLLPARNVWQVMFISLQINSKNISERKERQKSWNIGSIATAKRRCSYMNYVAIAYLSVRHCQLRFLALYSVYAGPAITTHIPCFIYIYIYINWFWFYSLNHDKFWIYRDGNVIPIYCRCTLGYCFNVRKKLKKKKMKNKKKK